MFSKLSPFRTSKQTPSTQNEKQTRYEKFNSEQYPTAEAKSNRSYFSPKSLFAKRSDSEVYYAEPSCTNSGTSSPIAAHFSDGNSSPSSLKTYSVYDGKESLSASSAFSGEINIGSHVLLPYEDAEEQFLEEHENYFLNLSLDNLRKDQYPKLELQRIAFLDHANCPLYSRFQVEQHMQYLLEETDTFLSLDSSTDSDSVRQNIYVDSICKHILNLLNTTKNDYSVIFTPDLSSCYRLFGEMYHFTKGSVLLASHDLHKFVKHMTHAAQRSNVKAGFIPLRKKDLCFESSDLQKLLRQQAWSSHGSGLLVYPAQSCLSGMCHSLSWIVSAQQNGWQVLLDVSSCLPMTSVDLSLSQPDFVIGSLFHMLGYPSNSAFMLVRRNSQTIWREKVSTSLNLAELGEIGKAVHIETVGEGLSIHTFAAFSFGLEHLESIGILAIQKRVESLVSWLIETLKSLDHKLNNKPLLQIYGSLDPKRRGSILTFNIQDSTGNMLPARLVQKLARRSNIFLGICCLDDLNAANFVHQKSDKQVEAESLFASACSLEAVRLSLGPVSTFDDAYRLAQFLSRFRDEEYLTSEAARYIQELEK